MRISVWSSDVCASDLDPDAVQPFSAPGPWPWRRKTRQAEARAVHPPLVRGRLQRLAERLRPQPWLRAAASLRRAAAHLRHHPADRSEEHTSELQSLMRISYAVFCLKKKKTQNKQ